MISKMLRNHHMLGYFQMFHAIFHNKHLFGSRSTVCQQADEVLSNPAKRICIQKCQKKAEHFIDDPVWIPWSAAPKSQHGTQKSQEFTIGKSWKINENHLLRPPGTRSHEASMFRCWRSSWSRRDMAWMHDTRLWFKRCLTKVLDYNIYIIIYMCVCATYYWCILNYKIFNFICI